MEITLSFNNIVESIYSLGLDEKLELFNLLEHNIADSRREEIVKNFEQSKLEEKEGKLEFSSDINLLKKMI